MLAHSAQASCVHAGCRNTVTGAGEADHEVLAGTMPAPSAPGQPQPANGGALPPPPALTAADAKRLRKAQKKAGKEQRRSENKVRSCAVHIDALCQVQHAT